MTATYEGRLFIDGEFREVQSGDRFEVINPAGESVVGTAARPPGTSRWRWPRRAGGAMRGVKRLRGKTRGGRRWCAGPPATSG